MTSPPAPNPRPRLRVERIDHTPTPDGHAHVRVILEWKGAQHVGESDGVLTRQGSLRAGAEATLQALASAAGDRLHTGLVGIKALRAFDRWIVVSSVAARSPQRAYKLLGARAAGPEGMVHAAVLSVLDAVNRVIEHALDS